LLDASATLVLIVHLLLVNVAAGAPMLCVWLEWRSDALARRAAGYLGRMALASLLTGGLVGGVVAWLKWTPAYRDLWLGPLRYKLHWAVAEFVFSLVLALLYCLLVRRKNNATAGSRLTRAAISLLNGSNLLYHFPSLFVIAGKLHEAGQTRGDTIYGAAFRQLVWKAESPAVTIHAALASVAVAGVALLALALSWLRRDEEPADVAKIATWGGRWALVTSILQIPVGLWALLKLSPDAQSQLLGEHLLATLLFGAAMLAALWLLRELVVVSLGEVTQGSLIRANAAMIVVVALMTMMQQQVRLTATPSATPIRAIHDELGALPWQPRF
jgi:hypothetical protein